MSVIPVSCFEAGELALLGNDLAAAPARRRRGKSRQRLRAVNRSLSRVGEQVTHLYARSRTHWAAASCR